jgi:hypothetical protein
VSLDILIAALIAVESGGRDTAIGDGGRAIGPLQIHKSVVQDVNRLIGASYQWNRMTNRSEAISVCKAYLTHYGKGKSVEAQARIWNGGPTGDRKSATLQYWEKVRTKIK